MKRRHVLNAFAIPLWAASCTRPDIAAAGATRPPPGAVTADARYPAPGATWNVRITNKEIFYQSVEDKDIAAASVDFNGRQGYGLTSTAAVRVLNPATFNTMGTILGGKVASMNTPDMGPFSWPLWVGKSWVVAYSHADFVIGRFWPSAKADIRVAALEDVTVPAGTLRAFRIECKAGIGTESSGGRREAGETGIGSTDSYWYAPGPKLVVKSVMERSGTHYRGAGRTTMELLRLPA